MDVISAHAVVRIAGSASATVSDGFLLPKSRQTISAGRVFYGRRGDSKHTDTFASVSISSFLVSRSNPQISYADRGFHRLLPKSRRMGLQQQFMKVALPVHKASVAIAAHGGNPAAASAVQISTKEGSIPPVSTQRRFPFYVMLPVDTVSVSNTLNHVKAIQAGVRALKVLGVDGVMMKVWWGIVEGDAPTKYNWSAYLDLVKMIQAEGLKIQASMCFHGCKRGNRNSFVSLPSWVLKVGDSDPDVFYTDRAANRYRDCLSLAVDNLPVFEGRSPLQMYSDMLKDFRNTFAPYIGNTIVEISVGLGPSGELRYPSFPEGKWRFPGVGEFQCYDKYMLANLKQHSEAAGHPKWGLGGPHDAPSYNQWPNDGGFFNNNGGSWSTSYGEFFLSWYTEQLIAHGDRMLSLATSIFQGDQVIVAGKLPAIHWWYKTKSHAAELTAGFYNVEGRDGYDALAEMFAKNASLLILPQMDVSDMDHPKERCCGPESLFLQIRRACCKHGVPVAGENSFSCFDAAAFKRLTNNVHLHSCPDIPHLTSFTFSSMGESLFFPDHWRLFINFFRNMDQQMLVDNETSKSAEGEVGAFRSVSDKELVQI